MSVAGKRIQKNIRSFALLCAVVGIFIGGYTGIRLAIATQSSTVSAATTTSMVGVGGKCLDNYRGRATNKNKIELYTCNGSAAQIWTYTAHTIKGGTTKAGYCLDIPYSSKAARTAVQLYACNGGAAQTWIKQSNNTYRNPNSGLCLDDDHAITTDGNRIWTYACNGNVSQQWVFKHIAPVTPVSAVDPSGQSMPTGNLPGWTYAFGQNFKTAASMSDFRTAYASSWCGYKEGEGGGKYYNDKVISAHDGVMDFKLTGKLGAAGSFGPQSLCHGNVYGRYSMRIKAVGAAGNGAAIQLWPSGTCPPAKDCATHGEDDFPEGSFEKTMSVHHHITNCTNCSNSRGFDTGVTWTDWHTVTIEWTASSVTYYLDGKAVEPPVTDYIPFGNHRYTVQMLPTSSTPKTGDFLIDWVAIWTKS